MSDFEPSDWKNTKIPKLAQLDSLQRCLICKDYLKAPVITSCNHTFCSQCIRQHLMSVSRCPLCKAEQFESNLKRVILLEEIVLCFQALRDDLVSVVGSQPETHTPSSLSESKKIEIIEIPDVETVSTNPTPVKEQKLDPGYVHCPVCGEVMKEEHVQGSHLDYCLNGKPDPKLLPQSKPVKRKTNDVVLFFQGQKRQKKAVSNIDHEKFYFNHGEKHHHDTKRIPKVDFSSLSTTKVKEKLTALKLSTLGSRTDLEWRYNQYYLLHQSNLDSSHPLSEMELRQKLNQWEVSRLAAPASNASNTIYGDSLSRKCISDKDFPIKPWLEFYQDEFRSLVKQARKSRNRQLLTMAKNGSSERVSTPNDCTIDTSDRPENTPVKEENQNKITQNNKGPQDTTGNETGEADPFDFSKSTLFAPE